MDTKNDTQLEFDFDNNPPQKDSLSEEITPVPDNLKALKDEIKTELLREMKQNNSSELEQEKIKQQLEKSKNDFIKSLKDSKDPIFSFIGIGPETENGLKVEMEWNQLFIDMLKKQQITGADDQQIINNWLILILHQAVEQDENYDKSSFE